MATTLSPMIVHMDKICKVFNFRKNSLRNAELRHEAIRREHQKNRKRKTESTNIFPRTPIIQPSDYLRKFSEKQHLWSYFEQIDSNPKINRISGNHFHLFLFSLYVVASVVNLTQSSINQSQSLLSQPGCLCCYTSLSPCRFFVTR